MEGWAVVVLCCGVVYCGVVWCVVVWCGVVWCVVLYCVECRNMYEPVIHIRNIFSIICALVGSIINNKECTVHVPKKLKKK
jgi:hypothetical protein